MFLATKHDPLQKCNLCYIYGGYFWLPYQESKFKRFVCLFVFFFFFDSHNDVTACVGFYISRFERERGAEGEAERDNNRHVFCGVFYLVLCITFFPSLSCGG